MAMGVYGNLCRERAGKGVSGVDYSVTGAVGAVAAGKMNSASEAVGDLTMSRPRGQYPRISLRLRGKHVFCLGLDVDRNRGRR